VKIKRSQRSCRKAVIRYWFRANSGAGGRRTHPQNRIRGLAGDKVLVEMTPYDLAEGRITYRFK